jgi:hypothetical protein
MWHYQGTLTRSEVRRWAHYWTQRLGWGVCLERTRRGHYHTFLKFPRSKP